MAPFTPRPKVTTNQTLTSERGEIRYSAEAGWQPLFARDQPIAEMFYVAYLRQLGSRPLTFVFNGGPGAASAYLHMGALGPKRVVFGSEGQLPKPPLRVVDNAETWLSFTDLVFIDPMGTGFSRSIPDPDSGSAAPLNQSSKEKPQSSKPGSPDSEKPRETEFWDVERDLQSLGEFMRAFLSQHKRWLSPIFIAGESYGGFRVAKLVRRLQQEFGIGLSGAILISPALEFSLFGGSDYNLTPWLAPLPSLATTAAFHGKVPGKAAVKDPKSLQAYGQEAEQFARQRLVSLLVSGTTLPTVERETVYRDLATLIGLDPALIERHRGRIDIGLFARELLRDQQRVLGVYDASVSCIDPFPDRPTFEGADPTLDGLDRLFTGAINHHLRDTLGVETDLAYHLLNEETFKAWTFDPKGEFKQGFVGAIDDLRIGMSLNPHTQIWITHGLFDLVTPYFASNHLVDLMNLDPHSRDHLTLKHYPGGHMFYSWEYSRKQWFEDMTALYKKALNP